MPLETKRGEDSGEDRTDSRNSRLFFLKEVFDRLGYGFGAQQFINILLYQLSSSIFLVGAINGVRAFLSVIASLLVSSYSAAANLKRKLMGAAGILFGFCFLFMAVAYFFGSVLLFVFALLLATAGVVAYGDIYQEFLKGVLKPEKRGHMLGKIAYYGILITAISILIGGLLMDLFSPLGTEISLNIIGREFSFKIFGYLIVFELAAIFFILSGYVFSFVKEKEKGKQIQPSISVKQYLAKITQNRVLLVMVTSSLIIGIAQILANSYYSIFIYQTFYYTGFGFFIVALIFSVALVTSLLAPYISQINAKLYGKFPMLVFGTLLLAITPLTYYYNPSFVAIVIATMLGVMGSVIVGVAHSLLVADFMREEEVKKYFRASSMLISVSCLFFVPAGAYLAQIYGLQSLFLVLGIVITSTIPLYLTILVSQKEKI